MQLYCANVNSQEWKDLVKVQGKSTAGYLWNKYKGFVPSVFYSNSIEKVLKNQNNLYRQAELGDQVFEDVRDTLYTVFMEKRKEYGDKYDVDLGLGTGTNKGNIANDYGRKVYNSNPNKTEKENKTLKIQALNLELAYEDAAATGNEELKKAAGEALKTFITENGLTVALRDTDLNRKVRNVYKNIYKNWYSKEDPITGNLLSVGWRDVLVDRLLESGVEIKGKEVYDADEAVDLDEMSNTELQLLNTTGGVDKIYGRQHIEENPAKKLTGKVKELLATIPSGKRNWLGKKVYLNKDEVYKSLLNIWVNKQSFTDMYSALETLVKYKSDYRHILDFIKELDGKDKAMFYTAFATNYNKFSIFKKEITPNGVTVKIFDSNLKTVSKSFIGKWRQQSVQGDLESKRALYRLNEDGKLEIKESALKEIRESINTIEAFRKNRKLVGQSLVVEEGVHPIVRALGNAIWHMSMNIGDDSNIGDTYSNLQLYINNGDNIKNDKGIEFLNDRQLFLNLYEKVKLVADSLENDKVIDIYQNNKGDIEYIARILPYFINQVGDSFTNGSGKQIYPANQETELDQIINSIKDPSTAEAFRGMYLQDAFISGYNSPKVMSYLFQHFGNSKFLNEFELRTLDTVIDDSTFENQDYSDFSKLDSIVARMNAYINNGNKKVHYTSITLGSRGALKMFAMPRIGNEANYGINTTPTQEIRKQILQDFIRIKEADKFIETVKENKNYSDLLDGIHYTLKKGEEISDETILEALKNRTGREFSNDVMQFTVKNAQGEQIVTDEFVPGTESKLNKYQGYRISHYIQDYILDSTKLDPKIKGFIDSRLDDMVKGVEGYFQKQSEMLFEMLKESGKLAELDIVNFKKISPTFESLAKDFVTNDALARNELVKLIRGRRSMAKDVVDFYKRMELAGTPGTRLAEKGTVGKVDWMSEEYGVPKTLFEATIQDIKLNMNTAQTERINAEADALTQNLLELNYDPLVAKQIGDAYRSGNVEGTDALAHISLDAYRYIRQGLGQWTREENEAFKAYKAAPAGQKIFAYQEGFVPKGAKVGDRIPILPMKPFYGALKLENNMLMSVIHKNSYQVLLEEYTKNFPVLEDLRNTMETRNIHIVNTVSAKKLARKGVHVVKGIPGEFNNMAVQSIASNGLRFPQTINPTKAEKKQIVSKQLKKVILSGVEANNIYSYNAGLADATAVTGADIKRNFEKALEEKMAREIAAIEKELGFSKLKKALNTKNTEDILEAKVAIMKAIKQILKENVTSRQLSSNYMRALDIEIDATGNPRFKTPIDMPFYAKKFESIILSVFQKRAFDQKISGYEAVQVAQIGGHATDNELKFLSIDNDPITGKRIVHAECMIREDLAAQFGINPGDSLDSIPEELRRIIGYRTPTQGKSSVIILKITKVLPNNYEKAIVVPGQITKMMGSDFDVDKLNLLFSEKEEVDGMLRKVKVDYNKLNATKNFKELSDKQVNNVIFDTIEAVMSNPAHALEIFKPLDSNRISSEQERIREAFPEFAADLEWNSPLTESEITDRNIVAAKLVGKYANMASGRNVVVNGSVKVADEYAIKLDGQIHSLYQKTTKDGLNESTEIPISDKLTGALDASKNPAQKELNDNLITANITAMFMALYPESNYTTLHNFLNQPIIRDFTDSMAIDFKNNAKNVSRAYKKVFNKWRGGVTEPNSKGIEVPRVPLAHKDIQTRNMSSAELANFSREDRNKAAQLDMLDNFYKFYIGGRQLFKLYKRVTPDTLNSINRVGDFQAFNDVIKKFDSDEENENKTEPTAWLNAANPNINVISQFIGEDSVYGLTKLYDDFLENTFNNIKQIFNIRLSPAFEFLKDTILESTGRSDLTSEMHEAMDNGMYFMLLMRENSPIKNMFKGEQIRRMYTNKDSNLVSTFRNLKAKAPTLATNYVINALEEDIDAKANIYALKFTGSFGLEPFIKEKFIKAFEKLLYSPESYATTPEVANEIKLFAEDLIANNFIRYGFRSGYGSYADIIPHQFFNTPMKTDTGMQTINEYLHNQKIALQSPNYFTPEDVIEFVQMFGGLQIKGSTLLNRQKLDDVKSLTPTVQTYPSQTFMIFYNSERTESGLYIKANEYKGSKGEKLAEYIALDRTYAKNKLYGIHKDASNPAYKDRLNAIANINVTLSTFVADSRRSEKEDIQKLCL